MTKLKTYSVTVHSIMTEVAYVVTQGTSKAAAKAEIQALLDSGGWSEVFGDCSGHLVDVDNKVTDVNIISGEPKDGTPVTRL